MLYLRLRLFLSLKHKCSKIEKETKIVFAIKTFLTLKHKNC